MTDKVGLSRRTFLAANAAVAAAGAVPSVAAAATAEPAAQTLSVGWHNVTGKELAAMVGDRFRVKTRDGRNLVLKLIEVEPVASGAARPSGLPRAEGVVAVFDSPDKAPVLECGCGIYRVSHARLGAADMYMGPSPRRRGDHIVELVLN